MSLPCLLTSASLRKKGRALWSSLDRFFARRGVQVFVFVLALLLFWILESGVAHAA